MRISLLPVVIASAFVVSAVTRAQTPVSSSQGTASIAGTIVAADGAPIARAIVSIGGPVAFTLVTDDRGRFDFLALPAGQYTVTASKTGFLAMAYGQAEPGRGSGLPLDLKAAERRADLHWILPRAASIAGRILDQGGQPMRGAIVLLQRRRFVDGAPQLVSCCGQATTDSNGLYRLRGVPPGEYAVSAIPPGDYLAIPEVFTTYGSETRRTTDEEVQWALRELSGAAASRAPAAANTRTPARSRTVSYGRIYYPGTPDGDRATMVVVRAGDEKNGIDLSMTLQPTAFIRARVVGPDGQPAANVSLSLSDGWSTSGARLGADGVFTRRNLLAGRYTLSAKTVPPALGAYQVVDLNGVDVSDLVMTLGPVAHISGRVVFEGDPAPDLTTTQVSVLMRPLGLTSPARVAADGTFTVPAVDPGRYRLSVTIPAASRGAWTLKSAMVDGRDAADVPFEIAAGQAIGDVVVTLTSRPARLSGLLLTADGAPAAGYYVVAFADDPAMWVTGGRRVPAPARSSTEGRYTFAGLPPGTYRLAALTAVDASDLANPDFLAALKAQSMVVTIADGENKVQDLRFGR
ncbi:MAG TPA: carboxypeptidase-like regulatory domain-containing protein [Vicinamibacterales bacterium]|nr:carboxypeptidase-like regulatory domain-containing protein [Vicinamibacterales bacterium]